MLIRGVVSHTNGSGSFAMNKRKTELTSFGAIGCSGGTDSQDEIVSKAGAAVINQLPARNK
jgi:uncharacterized protein GlcG (DUF336 family)